MTQGEKQILLKDLCARLPYGVKVHITDEWFYDKIEPYDRRLDCDVIKGIRENQYAAKPYLRPMSSMTEEEKEEFEKVMRSCTEKILDCPTNERWYQFFDAEEQDFMNAHHFDYRGLIPMGLALEAHNGMYKTS